MTERAGGGERSSPPATVSGAARSFAPRRPNPSIPRSLTLRSGPDGGTIGHPSPTAMRTLLLAAALAASPAFAQWADTVPGPTSTPGFDAATHVPAAHFGGLPLIYSNGGLATGTTTGSGVAVPTPGYQWSEVQSEAGNTTEANTTAGIACSVTTSVFRCADDVTVPAGQTWTVDAVSAFAYQTGYAGALSPFTAGTLRIWDGPPNDPGSTVIFGDDTTNRLQSSFEASLYRVFNTTTPPPGTAPATTRRIWENIMTVSPGLVLTEGTYWVDFNFQNTASSAHFTPSVTTPGTRGLPGANGIQLVSGSWTSVIDTGNPSTAPDVPQALPFQVYGSIAVLPATAFTFVAPTATSSYRAGGSLKPIWTTTPLGGSGDVTATLRKGGTDVATIYAGPNLAQPDFGLARYAIPLGTPAGADYTVYVELDSNPAVNAESDAFSIVDPPVGVTAPTGSEPLIAGTDATVTFTTSGLVSPITARVYLRRTGIPGGTLIAREVASDGEIVATIPAETAAGTDYFLLVRATDGTTTATGKSPVLEIEGVPTATTAPATSHYVVAAEASTREAYLLVDTDGLAGEIGVFAGDVLVGAARVAGATTEVVVFGADLEDGAPLAVRHFDGVETTLAATAFADGEEIAIAKGAAAGAAVTLRVAPNPTAGTAVVRVSAPAEVSVYDVLGRRVADLGTVETEARWDASGASPGVYVVRATSASGVESVRVTVSR